MEPMKCALPDSSEASAHMTGPPPPRWLVRTGTFLALLCLYAFGVAHWVWFFNHGDLTLGTEDWPKERMYFEVLADAVREGRVPYHVALPEIFVYRFPQLNNFTPHRPPSPPVICRFLAMPETTLSPQVVLLAFMNVGPFVLVHNLLLYSLGFLGSLSLRERYGLSLVPFAAFFVLFNFNGYITSRLSVGHSMWSGYFLLPFFGLYILEWLEARTSWRPPLKLALVLFGILLQGSLHMVTWCWILVGLIAIFNGRLRTGALLVLALSGLLSAFRLAPGAVAFWRLPRLPFSGGYPTLKDVLDGLIVIRDPGYPWVGGLFEANRWWEYDIYIGILGLAMLAYFGIYRRFDKDIGLQGFQYPELDLPLLVLTLFSLSGFYAVIYQLPLPLFNSERVTCRFLIIPLVMVLTMACIRMQRVLEGWGPNAKRTVFFVAAILVTAFSLLTHSDVWRIVRWEDIKESRWGQGQTAIAIDQVDAVYTMSVHVSLAVSAAALVGWVYLWLRTGPTERVLNRRR
jgi:hypothetical protein